VTAAVGRFMAISLLAVVLLAAAGLYVQGSLATDDAIEDAKSMTELAGHGIVAPNLTDAVLRGEPDALAGFDALMRGRVLKGSVVRVKVWSTTGRVIYSDEPRLTGKTFTLDEDDLATLRTGATDAGIGSLVNPENRFDGGLGKVLEVYTPLTTPSGTPVLYESYERFDETAASGRQVWRAFAPPLIGAVLLLWLAQAPLAWRMARRLQSGARERERLLRGTIESTRRERQRIASDLHDSVVQNLAGTVMTVEAAAGGIETLPAPRVKAYLREAAGGIHVAMRQLRDLIFEINPPNLKTEGLAAGLGGLVAPLAERGIRAEIHVPDPLNVSPDLQELLYRGAQEAVRNVVAHSGADSVEIRVTSDDRGTRLSVDDNGRGIQDGDRVRAEAEGHVGLSLLTGLVSEVGGSVAVQPRPDGGTSFILAIPTPHA
jgi:two-component system, NarL family, sensor kinase